MKALTYVGPAAAVDVPLPPDYVEFVTVKRGESVEFAPDHWRALLDQADSWVATSDYEKQPKKPTEPAVEEPAAAETDEGGDD